MKFFGLNSIVAWFCLAALGRAAEWPGATWSRAKPADVGMLGSRLDEAREFALQGAGSGAIVRHGKWVYAWGDQAQTYDIKSSSKSIGVTVLGLALLDGKVKLDDKAITYHPEIGVPPESNAHLGWREKITLRQLANQMAGFEKTRGFGKLLFEPGTHYFYSDGGPNWLAECLTLVYGRDLNEVMFERVFTPLGLTPAEIRWRNNSLRPHTIKGVGRREFGSGFSANMNAMARIGYLYLREGRWRDRQIISAEFVRLCSRPAPELRGLPEGEPTHGNASEHYSLLWWNNADGRLRGIPPDAFWSAGLYNSYILVVPSLDLVAVRAGKGWPEASSDPDGNRRSNFERFFGPIIASIREFKVTGSGSRSHGD